MAVGTACEVERLRNGLKQLRDMIHACNRNPIPNSKRVEWRDYIDSILAAEPTVGPGVHP